MTETNPQDNNEALLFAFHAIEKVKENVINEEIFEENRRELFLTYDFDENGYSKCNKKVANFKAREDCLNYHKEELAKDWWFPGSALKSFGSTKINKLSNMQKMTANELLENNSQLFYSFVFLAKNSQNGQDRDSITAAMIESYNAIVKFDPTKKLRFSTYLQSWVRYSVKKEHRDFLKENRLLSGSKEGLDTRFSIKDFSSSEEISGRARELGVEFFEALGEKYTEHPAEFLAILNKSISNSKQRGIILMYFFANPSKYSFSVEDISPSKADIKALVINKCQYGYFNRNESLDVDILSERDDGIEDLIEQDTISAILNLITAEERLELIFALENDETISPQLLSKLQERGDIMNIIHGLL